jgi:para-aminobenzoate synthetase component I
MNISFFRLEMNRLGKEGIPFLFVVDFEMQKPLLIPLAEVNPSRILYEVNGITNYADKVSSCKVNLEKFPFDFEGYRRKFDLVTKHLRYGDTFLTNLTAKTRITIDQSLRSVFAASNARYKLWYDDQFLVFSPEIFIQIRDGIISSYPMKGTADASMPDAKNSILMDVKETSEHVTIVDLIRNDLSLVADNVKVRRFRYIDEIETDHKRLLQVSSEIVGALGNGYRSSLGDILVRLLPAGSVSGAPKMRTVDVIREAEGEERGYYTGVFGIFDGANLDSGVMIRFIEKNGDEYFYRSGGGITTQSVVSLEYQELIDKVYVPIA